MKDEVVLEYDKSIRPSRIRPIPRHWLIMDDVLSDHEQNLPSDVIIVDD